MTDWANLSTTELYGDLLQTRINDRDLDAITQFRGRPTPTNLPINAVQFNDANGRWESWNGAAWEALTATYQINVDQVDGWDVGNGVGKIAVNNAILNQNLIAHYLGGSGQDAAFFRNASNLNAGTVPQARLPDYSGTYMAKTDPSYSGSLLKNGYTLNTSGNVADVVNLAKETEIGVLSEPTANVIDVGVLSGQRHSISGGVSVIAGGYDCEIIGSYSGILTGLVNSVTAHSAAICAGSNNSVTANYSCIGAGSSNLVWGSSSFIGAGQYNEVSGYASSVVFGNYCEAFHRWASANGGGSKTRADYDFVIGNNSAGPAAVTNNTIRLEGAAGNVKIDGAVSSPEADYAEYFEWADGNPDGEDRVGYFVSLSCGKINIGGEHIVGVISANPAVIGDASPNHWHGMLLRDSWDRTIYYDVIRYALDDDAFLYSLDDKIYTIPPSPTHPRGVIFEGSLPRNADGERMRIPAVNPEYDPSQDYLERGARPEYDAVGLLGKLWVRAVEEITGAYVDAGPGGKAITGSTYPVIARRPGQVRILFK